jgi:hypothetical protein
MDDLRVYARDVAAEVRRVPSVLMVALALLLFALSTSSEVVSDARVALMNELRSGWSAMQMASGGQDVRRVRWSFSDAAFDDLELQ